MASPQYTDLVVQSGDDPAVGYNPAGKVLVSLSNGRGSAERAEHAW